MGGCFALLKASAAVAVGVAAPHCQRRRPHAPLNGFLPAPLACVRESFNLNYNNLPPFFLLIEYCHRYCHCPNNYLFSRYFLSSHLYEFLLDLGLFINGQRFCEFV